MAKPLSIAKCLEHINELAIGAAKMRVIIDAGDKFPYNLRYQAAVTEEHLLEVITKHIEHINDLKVLSANGTVNQFNSKY